MFKKIGLLSLMAATMLFAATGASSSSVPSKGAGMQEKKAEHFSEMKSKIIAEMNKNHSERIACINAATDKESMQKCRELEKQKHETRKGEREQKKTQMEAKRAEMKALQQK